jgi:hypothetical protein
MVPNDLAAAGARRAGVTVETNLLMMVVDESRKEKFEPLLDRSGVLGYTEIPHALGVGATGPRPGSRAFSRTSAIILTVVPTGALNPLVEGIRTYCGECGERLRMFAWSVEDMALTADAKEGPAGGI